MAPRFPQAGECTGSNQERQQKQMQQLHLYPPWQSPPFIRLSVNRRTSLDNHKELDLLRSELNKSKASETRGPTRLPYGILGLNPNPQALDQDYRL